MREVRQELKQGRLLEAGADVEAKLTGLLLVVCTAHFLTAPRTTGPEMAPPTMGWALPRQSLIKKMHVNH